MLLSACFLRLDTSINTATITMLIDLIFAYRSHWAAEKSWHSSLVWKFNLMVPGLLVSIRTIIESQATDTDKNNGQKTIKLWQYQLHE